MKKLIEINRKQTINISEKLNESFLGKLLMGIGLALLGYQTYTVIKGNRSEIDALNDFMSRARVKEELKVKLMDLWKELQLKERDPAKVAKEFKKLTGIEIKY